MDQLHGSGGGGGGSGGGCWWCWCWYIVVEVVLVVLVRQEDRKETRGRSHVRMAPLPSAVFVRNLSPSTTVGNYVLYQV